MGSILLYVIGIIIYIMLPISIDMVIFVIDAYVPDPIPFVDEIVLLGILVKKIKNGAKAYNFFKKL